MERDDQGIAAERSPATGSGDGGQPVDRGEDQRDGRRDARLDARDDDSGARAKLHGGVEGGAEPQNGERGVGADGDMDYARHGAVHGSPPRERRDGPDVRVRHPRLVALPVDVIRTHAREVLPWLEAVAENSNGRFTVAGMAPLIEGGSWQLWAVASDKIDAVVATSIDQEPSGLCVLSIIWANGAKARDWTFLTSSLERWAKEKHGAQRVDILARKGWAKHLPQYRMTHVLLEKDL